MRYERRGTASARSSPSSRRAALAGLKTNSVDGMRLLDLAAALHHRAALLSDGDDQRFVRVRRIFVGREVGAQQAEAGEMPVPPILRRVPADRCAPWAIFTNTDAPCATSLRRHDRPPLARPRARRRPRPTPTSGMSPEPSSRRSRSLAGHRGAWLLRREVDGRTEFLALTLWDHAQAIEAFAGPDIAKSVVEPEARPCCQFDDFATHYEVAFRARLTDDGGRVPERPSGPDGLP